ncbi:murein biosynthesis integral membrane protein MurJ [Allokutzneria multivorans]|uniref:Murein biosynthesis integral membrane protein MurJ n=1 Tax=Allokutzneria multivorans TaxID=1142134 RepID=A0ABP7RH59_9PSEU
MTASTTGANGPAPLPAKPEPSLAKTSGSMAIATLVSRITGFGSRAMLLWIIGSGVITDSYNAALTVPLQIYELLLGGVLTSILVPLLVRAQKDDADGGLAYTQRLLTMGPILATGAAIVAVACAPLLTRIYVDGSTNRANPDLATAFAYLLLPEIVFFAIGALFMAVLNARGVFGPTAWAPVMNNVVVVITLGVYALLPGELTLDPVRMTDAHLLVLGVGTTLGIAVQAFVMLPAMRRAGVRFRWRWGWDKRLTEFAGLAGWTSLYAVFGIIGIVVNTRVATAADNGALTQYSLAWQLFQLPYGILGVSLLTAIMPRMSRNAADGNMKAVVGDLGLGTRLMALMLVPVSGALTVIGGDIGVSIFNLGKTSYEQAYSLGSTLAVSAFGLLPYAVNLLQMRVFQSMKDARTPALIMLMMMAFKIPAILLCPKLLDPDDVVLGLAVVNSATFLLGWVIGDIWLRVRLGKLGTAKTLRSVALAVFATVIGGAIMFSASVLVDWIVPVGSSNYWYSVVSLITAGPLGLIATFAVLAALDIEELRPALAKIGRLVRRK